MTKSLTLHYIRTERAVIFYEQSKKDNKSLSGKEATGEPGEVSGDSVAKTALAKKEVNMTWEDLLADFFTTIVPSKKTTRQINKYQLSTYKAIAYRQGGQNDCANADDTKL